MELALDDLRRAADLFRPVYDADRRGRRLGLFGGSPLLAHDAARSSPRLARFPAGGPAESLHQDSGDARAFRQSKSRFSWAYRST